LVYAPKYLATSNNGLIYVCEPQYLAL